MTSTRASTAWAIVGGALYAAAGLYTLYRLWHWYDTRVDDATTCVNLVFANGDAGPSKAAALVEQIIKNNQLPWLRPPLDAGKMFTRNESTAIIWDEAPPPSRPYMMMLSVCGRGKSLEWQGVAKNAEKMLGEAFEIQDATLQRDALLHVACESGTTCQVKAPLPLDFPALNATVLKVRDRK